MQTDCPSQTARGTALHRAAHQLLDRPPVFTDALALRIIGPEGEAALRSGEDRHGGNQSGAMRAFLAMRHRFAEDCLSEAMARGTRQYVVLGAGLDTFAYRADNAFDGLLVFEIDHPATQAWKRRQLADTGLNPALPVHYAAVNFETETLTDGLARAGFDFGQPAFFAWLGVTPYLTKEAMFATLSSITRDMQPGSEIVFDYAEPADDRDPAHRKAIAALAKRVAKLGEPLRSAFRPDDLRSKLKTLGFRTCEDWNRGALNARYFDGRADGLRLRGLAHLMRARL